MNAVIGNPLTHSLSPILHNEMYQRLGINNVEFIKEEGQDIEKLIKKIRNKPYELVAVTAPHKENIIKYLDEIDEVARQIGAVNTVINRAGKLHGYNTDLSGIAYALGNIEFENKKVLLVGAGGVAKAVAYFISQHKGKLSCYNRTQEKAEELAKKFGGRAIIEAELAKNKFDLIINTTSVGMYPDIDKSLVLKEILKPNQVVFDIVYNPLETKLLKEAKEAGTQVISGLGMFMAQGLKQIALWQDIEINAEDYYDDLRQLLINNLKSAI